MIKALGKRVIGGRLGRTLFLPAMAGRATIFMGHRFRRPGLDVEGPTMEQLRASLERLRRLGYPIVSVEELFRGLQAGGPGFDGAVAFTIDDGYAEQAEAAQSVFARYDCPVTIFLMTGFIDGTHWPWWDQIEYVLGRAVHSQIRIELPSGAVAYACSSPLERKSATADLIGRCKNLKEGARREAVEALSRAAEVSIPLKPPDGYLPLSWDQARRLERAGASFGAHSVSHPILSRVDDRQSRAEIEGSWSRLQAELTRPVPVFCYPNGKDGDYGPREMAVLAEMGFLGALGTERGYAERRSVRHDPQEIYAVDRFSFPESPREAACYASGVEHVKWILSGQAGKRATQR